MMLDDAFAAAAELAEKRRVAYSLLLAYAQCAATQGQDGLYDTATLTRHGWNGNSTWAFMKDLNQRALAAAKEAE